MYRLVDLYGRFRAPVVMFEEIKIGGRWIKGPRHISVASGEGQTGYRMLIAAKKPGEKAVRISLVVGQDPMIWLVSGSRIPERRGKKPVDELATAGGLRGKAVEIVKRDTNEIRVPAHAEMVIEGEVTLESFEPNGPYGEADRVEPVPATTPRVTSGLWQINRSGYLLF